MKKIMSLVVDTIIIGMLVWGAMSYMEIISKNVRPNPEYSNYNLFIKMTKTVDKIYSFK